VQNVSTGADYQSQVFAQPGQVIGYKVIVKAVGGDLNNVTLTDRLPNGIINVSALIVDGQRVSGNIQNGINLGNINEGNSVTVTYLANIADESNFGYGQTSLTNIATATSNRGQASSQAVVIVSRQAVQAATIVSTGFNNNTPALIMIILAGLTLIAILVLKTTV